MSSGEKPKARLNEISQETELFIIEKDKGSILGQTSGIIFSKHRCGCSRINQVTNNSKAHGQFEMNGILGRGAKGITFQTTSPR